MLTPQFALLLASAASFGLSFSTYFLLPKYLDVELSADPATIGGISAVSWLASVSVIPFVGVQIDRHGRTRFACLGGLIFAIASAGFLVVDSVGPLIWGLRVLQGFAFTLFFVSLSTLATDISPPERLGQAIGLFGAIMISTNAVGPALAEWLAEHFGWVAVFSCTVAAASLSAILALFIREQHKPHTDDSGTSMLQVIARPRLKRILIVTVMVGWTFGALFTFYQPWALINGFEQVSGFLIAYAVSAMFVRIGLGGLVDRVGRLRVAKAALLLYVVAPFSVIWLEFLGLIFTGGLLGFAHGLFYPALNAVAVDCTEKNERGKTMAAYNGAFNVGFSAGSFLLGYVVVATNYPTVFIIAGIICLFAYVLLATAPGIIAQHHR